MKTSKLIPNLFIVGSAKSGTTALWHYLKQHPQILMTENPKEPSFFSDFGKYIFSTEIEEYLKLFNIKNSSNYLWFGDASTAHLTDPASAGRIFEYNKNAKIIAILRNPIDRAYSLYNFMAMSGLESANTFEKALKLENQRLNKDIPNWYEPQNKWNYLYFNSGLYVIQIKRYLKLFKNNVLIIKYDDFLNSPSTILQQIYDFLKIKKQVVVHEKLNATQNFYSAEVQFISRECEMPYNYFTKKIDTINHLQKDEYLKKYFKIFLKLLFSGKISFNCIKQTYDHFARIKREFSPYENIFIFPTLGINNDKIPNMKLSTRILLTNKYAKEIKKLSKLTKINFDSWLER